MLLNNANNVSFRAVICRGKNTEGRQQLYFCPDNTDFIINKHSKDSFHIYNPNSSHPVETVKELIIDTIDEGSVVHYTETVPSRRSLIVGSILDKMSTEDKINILYQNGSKPVEFKNDLFVSNIDDTKKAGLNLYSKARASIEDLGKECFLNANDNSRFVLNKNEGEVQLNNNSDAKIAENTGEIYSNNESKIELSKNRGLLIAKDKSSITIPENFSRVALKDFTTSNIINNSQNGSIMISDNSNATIKNNKQGSIIIPRHMDESGKRTINIGSNFHFGTITVGDNGINPPQTNNDEIVVGANNGTVNIYGPGKVDISKVQLQSRVVAQGQEAIIDIKELDTTINNKELHLKNNISLLDGAVMGPNLKELFNFHSSKEGKPRIIAKTK